MTATDQYIKSLSELKSGELGLLRTHSGQGLDETVAGFDLFSGVWWPLRQKNERAPRREAAWLIAKLYACSPIEHESGCTLAQQLRRCQPKEGRAANSFQTRFDAMLGLPLASIEPALQWALGQIAARDGKLDWVKLTDDLSRWEQESTRLRWAEEYLDAMKG